MLVANFHTIRLLQFSGKKLYCMGDEITEIDCSIFGFLCQCKFHTPGSIYEQAVTSKFRFNIVKCSLVYIPILLFN